MQKLDEDKLPVIIFRGNDICFLGIMRSCADAGIPFKTVTFTWPTAKPWWSESSKYFTRDFEINNPFSHPEAALQDLIKAGKKLLETYRQPLLAIPSSDTNLMFLLDNEEVLSPYFTMMGDTNFNSFRNDAAHKYECAKLLEKSPVKITPATYRCVKKDDVQAILNSVEYPVVYKPATKDYGQSFYLKHNGLKAVECTDERSLKKGLLESIDCNFDVIVQEKILFDKVEDEIPFYAYVDANQNIRMAATGIKELIQPYPFGTANILRLSWHPELLEVANHVVKALKWRGILMIEFIRDKKDNKWKVIEVNVRPWLFIGFYNKFELNYISQLYDDWRGTLGNYKNTVISPSPVTLAKSPLHIDLNGIANQSSAEEKHVRLKDSALLNWLAEYGACYTTPYYCKDDSQPYLDSLQHLSNTTQLSKNFLLKNHTDSLYTPSKNTNYTCLTKPTIVKIS